MTTDLATDAVQRIRASIDHPIVDGDGHLLEFLPMVFDIVRDIAGDDVMRRVQRDLDLESMLVETSEPVIETPSEVPAAIDIEARAE